MNIGQASRATGVPAKMIRYYESTGLIRPAERTGGNYRAFGDRDINELRFIRRARTLGFSIEDIVILLSLWRDRTRPSREVRAVAEQRLADLHVRIAEMQAMADTLETLARCCAGDDRPDCPILAGLAAAREN
ncbi:Cu(I)-responsive transcriptional regulator [Brevundimonas diminuta]|uniref:Cu(I)-responsive transcriptional regulator n=2 Tax=Brevundimonas diminuta TaxID=293 RepID=A0A410NZ70_BREDI|nr:Cu(I)-responsive transcriptional regulator [Brevundimonas diminuta]MBD3819175.1 Cu(I)-responsive transcriptional regulator [Brevundimonas diminuta]QAT15095.1 Cu(I)-responsive transcriptional regulator [Brevundimonas diminuta]QQB87522.1 Cu(I)-responsive transcriptional regulator [Brevundimonas diminuta]